jgi:DDE superfamily endonuclease
MNGDIFRAYIKQILAPVLKPGDIVILDNLASHKVAGVREAIEARGVSLVYPPPYIAAVAADFLLNLIAYNRIRIPKLVAA